ncbi:hypothetical protein RB195_010930 [Necator americanus]|uniref:Uncharacterized protein n=1 Tax=Necator americanus TaxID=51031 RepID=A0ABR1D0E3_NECAM
MPALIVFVAYGPTSNQEEDGVEAFYMILDQLYEEDHVFHKNRHYRLNRGRFSFTWKEEKGGERPGTCISWNTTRFSDPLREGTAVPNCGEEYDCLITVTSKPQQITVTSPSIKEQQCRVKPQEYSLRPSELRQSLSRDDSPPDFKSNNYGLGMRWRRSVVTPTRISLRDLTTCLLTIR